MFLLHSVAGLTSWMPLHYHSSQAIALEWHICNQQQLSYYKKKGKEVCNQQQLSYYQKKNGKISLEALF